MNISQLSKQLHTRNRYAVFYLIMENKNIDKNEIALNKDDRDIESAAERLAELFIMQVEYDNNKNKNNEENK